MDEDASVKSAPVTRLRRRLSIENPDEASSPAPLTPSKKRGGKLAAKPLLDNIDENVVVASPKPTRAKPLPKETLELIPETTVTPTKRALRARSNSSISEVVSNVDSPRARRAARRTSQAGSDNEAVVTPARVTRRTRSSINKDTPVTSPSSILTRSAAKTSPGSEEKKHTPKLTKLDNIKDKITPTPKSATKKNNTPSKQHAETNEVTNEQEPKIPTNNSAKKGGNPEEKKHTPKHTTLNNSKDNNTASPKSATKKNNTPSKQYVDTIEVTIEKEWQKLTNDSAKKGGHPEEKKYTPKHTKLNNSKDEITPSPKSATKKKNTPSKQHADKKVDEQEITDELCKGIKHGDDHTIDKINDNHTRANSSLNLIDFNSTSKNDLKVSVHIDENSSNGDVAESVDKSDFNSTSKYDLEVSVQIDDNSSNGNVAESVDKTVDNELGDQCVPEMNNAPNDLPVDTVSVVDSSIRDVLIEIDTNASATSDMKMTKLASNNINISGCEPMDISYCEDTFSESLQKHALNASGHKKSELSLNNSKTCANNLEISLRKQSLNESTKNISINSKKSDISYSNDVNLNKMSRNVSTVNKSITLENSHNSSAKNCSNLSTKNSSDTEKNITANKSTLILSHLKDDSEIAANHSKSSKSFASRKSVENLSQSPLQTKNTPIHSKAFKKSGVQTSTPVALSNMQQNKKSCNISKLETSRKDTSESESDEDTKDSNDLLANEAEDAGDNYESGDSRNASDIEYEKQNEIAEKGETLTSGDDISNDTDYEKDSFVVSSDAEDEELLSGSGDDLSLSNNELSMSKKSKQKYNVKKTKEQKKASREMYNARHNVTEEADSDSSDDDISKPKKKYNRQRLDSTLLKSGDDDVVPKGKGKKESKTLDNSRNKSVNNENEISIINDHSMMDKEDPLAKINVKSEPITPMKEINMSVVNVETQLDIEEVQVDENASIIKAYETKDPLQKTINEFSSSSSDNEEILINYDDMLSKLCDSQKSNLSLNSDNKKNKDKRVKMLDELNITQSSTKKKTSSSKQSESEKQKNVTNQSRDNIHTEVSTDSMDMRLLFHDSGDDENKDVVASKIFTEDTAKLHDISLNTSKRKTKKDKLNATATADEDTDSVKNNTNDEDEKKRKSILDENIDPILVNSSKKKKRSKLSVSFADESHFENSQSNLTLINDNADESNLETSLTGSKQKKRKPSESSDVRETTCPMIQQILDSVKIQKNKRKSNSESVEDKPCSKMDHIIDSLLIKTDNTFDSSNNLSLKGKKNKSKSISESSNDGSKYLDVPAEETKDVDTTSKKNKNKKLSESIKDEVTNISYSLESAKKKKNKSLDASTIGLLLDSAEHTNLPTSVDGKKKKRKNNVSESTSLSNVSIHNDVLGDTLETSGLLADGKKKKQKKVSESTEPSAADNSKIKSPKNKPSIEVPTISDLVEISEFKKKKQKKISESSNTELVADMAKYKSDNIEPRVQLYFDDNASEDKVEVKSKHKKNKQKNLPNAETNESTLSNIESVHKKSSKNNSLSDNQVDDLISRKSSSKKKNKVEIEAAAVVPETNEVEVKLASKRKRLDLSQQLSNDENDAPECHKTVSASNMKKKQKISANEESESAKPKAKKRKERDDYNPKKVKAPKENVSIARLPAAVLSHIAENPQGTNKRDVVSTSQFKVENAIKRTSKPSNYLEESIYIDADSPIKKKHKKNREIPKVLPFLPTVSTSHEGFTTQFKINVIPRETKFIAQPDSSTNFKKDYLEQKIRKMGTYASYRNQRNIKLSKF